MENENVLCVKADLIKSLFESHKQYMKIDQDFITGLEFEFVERKNAETNIDYKQLIPYALVVNDNSEILYYHRCGSEKRLAGVCSAGLGGHVNDKDKGDNAFDKLQNGLCRELREEIGLDVKTDDLVLLGLINEEESEVGHVHTGVVFQVTVNANSHFRFDAEIGMPQWSRPYQLELDKFEKWSSLALQLKNSSRSTILISILSDYLEPNFLLIKELQGKYDELIFITTPKTRVSRKDVLLLKALQINDSLVRRIEVREDDVNIIQKALSDAGFSKEDNYLVNITGGTKVMSIAVYNYFSSFNSLSYYVPVERNEIRDMDGRQKPIPLNYRMNLEEYFTLYGLYFTCEKNLKHSYECAKSVFNDLKTKDFDRRGVSKIVNAQHLPVLSDRVYYSGGWFEEYVYCRLKKELGLEDDEIALGAKIYRNQAEIGQDNLVDNEIDVMFVLANKLYVFECKISIATKVRPQELVEGYLYKLAAISKDFGLNVNSYLVTTHNMVEPFNLSAEAIQHIFKRQHILGIKKILDCNCLLEEKIPLWNKK